MSEARFPFQWQRQGPRGSRVLRTMLMSMWVAGAVGENVALAFECSYAGPTVASPSLFWSTRNVLWWLDDSLPVAVPDGEVDARASFQVWDDVPCSDLNLTFAGRVADGRAEFVENGPNRNIVLLVESQWSHDPSAIAVTTTAFSRSTGEIVDADIELNGVNFEFVRVGRVCNTSLEPARMDVRNTLTHEIGHFFGLDHPPRTAEFAATTMFASAPPCETQKATLEQDDIDGICFIYPAGQPTQQCGGTFSVPLDTGGGCQTAGTRSDLWLFGFLSLAIFGLGPIRARGIRLRKPPL